MVKRKAAMAAAGHIRKYYKAAGRPSMFPQLNTAYNVARAAYGAYSAYKSFTKSSGDERTLTNERNVTNQYRKKRMPRYKKKQWSRFVKKVGAVADKLIGLKTVLFNNAIEINYAGAGQSQGWGVMHLYGRNGTNTSNKEWGAADLNQIYTNDPEMKDNFRASLVAQNGVVQFRSAVIDITMFNNTTATCEVDVYKIVYGHGEKFYAGWQFAYTDYLQTQQNISNGDNTGVIGFDTRGSTPFTCAGMLSYLNAKIVWKKKFILGGSQTAIFQHRDPRNRYVKIKDIASNIGTDSDLTYKGMTCSYLFMVKDVGNGTGANVLRVGATRSYTYKVQAKALVNRRNQVLA